MKIFKLVSIADVFTLINALLGFSSIISTYSGQEILALQLIMLAVIADGLDGVFARRFSKKWYLGDYLDLMSDTTSFCVAPAFLIFAKYFTHGVEFVPDMPLYQNVSVILACGFLIVCGTLRLARFCHSQSEDPDNFTGIATPATALTIALLILFQGHVGEEILPPVAITISAILLSVLMISDIKYLKLRGKIEYISGGLVLLAIFFTDEVLMVGVVLVADLAYVFLAPAFSVRKKKRKKKKGRVKKSKEKKVSKDESFK
jgi:CDP-diacylglycerol--serine O-phosphatidyltransferase